MSSLCWCGRRTGLVLAVGVAAAAAAADADDVDDVDDDSSVFGAPPLIAPTTCLLATGAP